MDYRKIAIFIGGSMDANLSADYHDTAIALGKEINDRGYDIVFDGCEGLPFLVYNELDDKMRSLMIYTDYWYPMPKISGNVRPLDQQSDVTSALIKSSDAMIFMKGGFGTVAEIMRALDSKKNKEHDNPILILNLNHEWDLLVNLLDSYDLGDLYFVTDNYSDGLDYIERELYKEGSKFRKNWVDSGYVERREPLITNTNKQK